MSMKKILTCVALLVATVVGSSAQAGVYGSALLSITNAKIERFNTATSTWVDALATDLQITGGSTTSINDVTLGVTNVLTGAAGFDALQAAINPVEAENFLDFHGQFNADYVRADTDGNGSLLGGANAYTVAEAFTTGAFASSLGNTAGTATVRVRVNRAGDYRLTFTGEAKMRAQSDGTAIGTAEIQFSAQINGGQGNLVSFAPGALNQTISSSGALVPYDSAAASYSSAGASLAAGQLYSFTIQQASLAGVVVPEPTSAVAFGLCALAFGLRRRRA